MNKKRGIVMPGGRLLLTHKEIWAACLSHSHTNGGAVREKTQGHQLRFAPEIVLWPREMEDERFT